MLRMPRHLFAPEPLAPTSYRVRKQTLLMVSHTNRSRPSPTQLVLMRRMVEGQWHSAFSFGLPTNAQFERVQAKGLIEAHIGPRSTINPTTAIKWRLTLFGLAELNRAAESSR